MLALPKLVGENVHLWKTVFVRKNKSKKRTWISVPLVGDVKKVMSRLFVWLFGTELGCSGEFDSDVNNLRQKLTATSTVDHNKVLAFRVNEWRRLYFFLRTHWSAIITPTMVWPSDDSFSSTLPTPANGSLSPSAPVKDIWKKKFEKVWKTCMTRYWWVQQRIEHACLVQWQTHIFSMEWSWVVAYLQQFPFSIKHGVVELSLSIWHSMLSNAVVLESLKYGKLGV